MTQVLSPGDKVMLFYGFADRRTSGLYEIVRSLPASPNDERQYQARGPDGFDRVIGEQQIRARFSDPDATSGVIRIAESPVRTSQLGSHIRAVSLAGRAA